MLEGAARVSTGGGLRANGSTEGLWEMPWGLEGVLWGPWKTSGQPRGGTKGTLREYFYSTGGIVKSLLLYHEMIHFDRFLCDEEPQTREGSQGASRGGLG